jgi:hypothetical protein
MSSWQQLCSKLVKGGNCCGTVLLTLGILLAAGLVDASPVELDLLG